MRFGEATVHARADFRPAQHLTRDDVLFSHDLDNRPFARLRLRSAKTAKPGEVQDVFLTPQGSLCALDALKNLGRVVPASPSDPLFSWRDGHGDIRPMTRSAALECITRILSAGGFGTTFGHSFRIGGAAFYLGQGVSPEIVRIGGRWKSLAYEAYIRAFEQVLNTHTGNIAQRYVP